MLLAKEKDMYLFIYYCLQSGQKTMQTSFSMFEWLGYIFFLLAYINEKYI